MTRRRKAQEECDDNDDGTVSLQARRRRRWGMMDKTTISFIGDMFVSGKMLHTQQECRTRTGGTGVGTGTGFFVSSGGRGGLAVCG